MIGLGTHIADDAEFNRRAAIAMRAIKHTSPFLAGMLAKIGGEIPLTEKQQQAFFDTVHSYRRQISDELVKDYAAGKAKGHDA